MLTTQNRAAMGAGFDNPHARGMLIAASGVLVLSFDALLIRLADSSAWNVVFWRGWFVCLSTLLLGICLRHRQQWPDSPALWAIAIATGVAYGINASLFVFSISHTSAANTVVILASSPLFAALFSRIFLGEKVQRRTLMSIIVSIAGVLVVFAGSGGGGGHWQGDLAALVLAIGMGAMFTLLRRLPSLPRLPLIALSGAVAGLISWPLAEPLSLPAESYGWLALMGLVQIPLATMLIWTAPKYLPSAEVSLFMLIETVLGPIWVWLVLGETTSVYTLAGGAAILGAIGGNTWIALRQNRRRYG